MPDQTKLPTAVGAFVDAVYGRHHARLAWARKAAADLIAGTPVEAIDRMPSSIAATHITGLDQLARVCADARELAELRTAMAHIADLMDAEREGAINASRGRADVDWQDRIEALADYATRIRTAAGINQTGGQAA